MIWKAYTDASVQEGIAAGGAWVIYKCDKFFESCQLNLQTSGHPECINNSTLAEAVVVRSIIRRLSKLPYTQTRTIIYTDSQAIVDMAVRNESVRDSLIGDVVSGIKVNLSRLQYKLEWLPRERNCHADRLSRRQRTERVKDKMEWKGTVLCYDSETKSVTKKRY